MLNYQTLFEALPGLYLILTTDFVIVAASDAYLRASMRKREEILGSLVFDAFPDNPDDPNATGVENLRASLARVLKSRQPHTMAMLKYDIRRPKSSGGEFEERYWNLVNSPVFGANGEITHIINRVEDVTEVVQFKQQEQTLLLEAQTAKADLEAVLANLQDGFLTCDRQWCYTYINDRQLEIIGMRREDVLGKNIWEIFPDLVGSELYHRFNEVMAEEIPTQFEYYYPAWNRWFENRVYPIPDGIAVLCAEISDRKAAIEAQLFLASLVESSNDAIVGCTPHRQIVHWNAGAERIFGYTSAEIIGQDVSIIVPAQMAELNQSFAALRRGEIINQMETVCRSKDGKLIDLEITVSPIKDANNRLIGTSAVLRDITKRKQAAIALRESEERFRQMAETIESVFWLSDPQAQKLLYVSPAYEQIWGRDRKYSNCQGD